MSETNSISCIRSKDGRLELEFHWNQDRFQQRLKLDGVEVGLSLEGGSSEAWPPSPPVQQLSIETIDDQPAALAVGAAGRGHWSLSGIPDPDHSSAVRLELACRCQEQADYLGSTYQLEPCLIVEPTDGDVEVGDIESVSGQADHRRITIRPLALSPTCRWSYRIEPAV